jgi:deoxyribodipyrimidine photolyase-like uncharacterized protein
MIIATPLDIPKLEPDSWEVFWDIWNTHADKLHKVRMNYEKSKSSLGSNNVWTGMDIYKRYDDFNAWKAPFYDIKDRLPNMYKSILSVDTSMTTARLVQSNLDIISHTDDNFDKWNIRAFLHNPSKISQWYFTRPNDSNGERFYLEMPKDTNWFMYNDKYAWHGTDYDPENKKILLQIYSLHFKKELLEKSKIKYKDYVIEI